MTKPITFFLVDDDEDDALLFEETLNECRPEIRFMAAENGKEALEILEREQNSLPDLLFLDLNMPRMDGKECLNHIKRNAAWTQIPVVIYTTSSHAKDVEETIGAGAVGFITKPSDVHELKTILCAIADDFPKHLGQTLRSYGKTPSSVQ